MRIVLNELLSKQNIEFKKIVVMIYMSERWKVTRGKIKRRKIINCWNKREGRIEIL